MNNTVHSPRFDRPLPKVESCEGCGLCCSVPNIVMPLSPDEAAVLSDAGTELVREVPVTIGKKLLDVIRPQRRCDFTRLGACALWDQESGECGIYEERPVACSAFKRGGYQCMKLRKDAGLISPEDFDNWREFTRSG